LAVIAVVCAVVLSVLSLLVAIRWSPLIDADTDVVRSAHRAVVHHHWIETVSKQVTQLGDPLVVDLAMAAAALAVATRRQWSLAILIAAVRLGELGLNSLVKVIVERPRPMFVDPLATAHGYSYPSGHAAGAAAMYGLLAVLVVRRSSGAARIALWAAMGVIIVAVAATRVLLGVHYPSDVAAGVLVGLGWLAACLYAVRERGR
jgi:undecaprenyl-diphosphatase